MEYIQIVHVGKFTLYVCQAEKKRLLTECFGDASFSPNSRDLIISPPSLPPFSHLSCVPPREESNLRGNNLIHHLFRLTFQTGSNAGCQLESHLDRYNSKTAVLIQKSIKRL